MAGHQSAVLQLYRSMLRAAQRMPEGPRRAFVAMRVREEFRDNKNETSAEEIKFMMALGLTQLESINVQATHLESVFSGGLIEELEAPERRQRERVKNLDPFL